MKRYRLLILLLLATLASCRNTQKQDDSDKSSTQSPSQTLIRQLAPIYHGIWIKADYLAEIKQTRSVWAARDKVTGITAMEIDTIKIAGDSLVARVGWDNHNGGEVTLKFVNGKQPHALKFGEDELGYQISGGDTSLILHQNYEGKQFATAYYKALNAQPEQHASYVMNYEINKALVAGVYKIMGGTNAKPVTFSAEGNVTGLSSFKSYFIENDLGGTPRNNLDRITFDMFSDRQRTFTYDIEGAVLKLYAIKTNADSTLFLRDKLIYTLVRIK